jgi:hypothetical protein
MGVHAFSASSEDAFDAVWLTLEAAGYRITSAERATGTFCAARPDGHTYDVTVWAEGDGATVSALPHGRRPLSLGGRDGEDAKWDALWAGTATLLDAWRRPPQWRYLTRTNTLALPDFAVEPPAAWARLDYDFDRRRARVLKRRGAPPGQLNPALLAVVQRRRPVSVLPELLREAAALALGARARLTLPEAVLASPEGEDALGGEVRLLDGPIAREVRWHAFVHRTFAWEVWLVMVCGADDDCEEDWRAVLASTKRHQKPPSIP